MILSRYRFFHLHLKTPVKRYCTVNYLKNDKDQERPAKDTTELFMKLLNLKDRLQVRRLIGEHKHMLVMDQSDIMATFRFLQTKDISIEDIKQRITVLSQPAITLQNHREVLLECGFAKVDAAALVKFLVIMNRSVKILQNLHYIPFDTDVPEHLAACLSVNVPTSLTPDTPLKSVRQAVLNAFLRRELDLTDAHLCKLWKVYHSLRHKSYQSIQRMIKLLQTELNFSKERIMGNLFVLHGDPDNVERILQNKLLGGMDVYELLNRRPKILMSPCATLLKTEQCMKEFGIENMAMANCIDVFTLSPSTVYERLQGLKKVEEFDVLINHPRVLRLVHYQMKARARLEYLKQLKVKCVSLHVLSSSSSTFDRYTREGADRTKGIDSVVYLSQIFKKPQLEIRNVLSRHPNWCHVSLLAIKKTYDHIKNRGFDRNPIYANIHILLYPIDRIEKQLKMLNGPNNLRVDFNRLSKTQRLGLVMYLIEAEFHFAGDGVWLEPMQQSELFATPLPEMPTILHRQYNFGRNDKTEKANYL